MALYHTQDSQVIEQKEAKWFECDASIKDQIRAGVRARVDKRTFQKQLS